MIVNSRGTASLAGNRSAVQPKEKLQNGSAREKINVRICFAGEFIVRARYNIRAVVLPSLKLLEVLAALAHPQIIINFLICHRQLNFADMQLYYSAVLVFDH